MAGSGFGAGDAAATCGAAAICGLTAAGGAGAAVDLTGPFAKLAAAAEEAALGTLPAADGSCGFAE